MKRERERLFISKPFFFHFSPHSSLVNVPLRRKKTIPYPPRERERESRNGNKVARFYITFERVWTRSRRTRTSACVTSTSASTLMMLAAVPPAPVAAEEMVCCFFVFTFTQFGLFWPFYILLSLLFCFNSDKLASWCRSCKTDQFYRTRRKIDDDVCVRECASSFSSSSISIEYLWKTKSIISLVLLVGSEVLASVLVLLLCQIISASSIVLSRQTIERRLKDEFKLNN